MAFQHASLHDFTVFRGLPDVDRYGLVWFKPVMTITATTAEDALRIAKQKGNLHPVVQPTSQYHQWVREVRPS